MVQPTQVRIKAEDYFASDEYVEHDLIQLIDGAVIVCMPPISAHQFIVGEILYFLMTLARNLGGRAVTSPIEVMLDENNVFEPDVLYLAADSQCEITEKRLIGAPELIVEVLSPSTARYDRQQKYHAYEKHGVREYWIVDPVHETIEVYVLTDNKFQRQGAYGADDIFKSSVLAHDVALKPLFPDASPDETD